MYGAVPRPYDEGSEDDDVRARLLPHEEDVLPVFERLWDRRQATWRLALLVSCMGLLVMVAVINPGPLAYKKAKAVDGSSTITDAHWQLHAAPVGLRFAGKQVAGQQSLTYAGLSDAEKQALFIDFKQSYSRSYENDEEEARRYAIFQGNLEKIDALNSRSASGVYALSRWADMTREEYSLALGLRLPNQDYASTARSSEDRGRRLVGQEGPDEDDTYLGAWDGEECLSCSRFPELSGYSLDSLPTSFDWRDYGAVTRVKDQGGCGSCWSFSAAGDMEGSWFLANNHELTVLSEQQILACDLTDFVCDGGYPASAFRFVIVSGGAVSEQTCAYNFTQLTVDTLGGEYCETFHDETVATFTGWYDVAHSAAQETLLQLALLKLGPISVAINAESMEFYSSGIDDPDQSSCPGGYNDLDHAVLLVGWGTEGGTNFWSVKNSWGEDWGEGGYWRVTRGSNACGIAMQAVHILAD